jgi:hypothetical protein
MSWADTAGNLWLYGGYGYFYGVTAGALWEYNIGTGQWMWAGESLYYYDDLPVYGTLGVASAGNSPGSRTGGVTWVTNGNRLWLFGGANGNPGANPNGLATEEPYNDLWMFTP